jgi:hypothetical protein
VSFFFDGMPAVRKRLFDLAKALAGENTAQ